MTSDALITVKRFFSALESNHIDDAVKLLTWDIRLETASRVEHGQVSIRVPLRMLMDYGFAIMPQMALCPTDGAVLADIRTPLGLITARLYVNNSGMIANIIAV